MEQQTCIAASMQLYYIGNIQKHYAKIIAEDQNYGLYEIPDEKAIAVSECHELKIEEMEELQLPKTAVQVIFSDEIRDHLLCTALEGGSNYWYYLDDLAINIINSVVAPKKGVPLTDRLFAALQAGVTVPINDTKNRSKKIGELSMASIIAGEQLMISKHINHFADALLEQWDAATADVWFQFACLKDITFG
jgi:hypothetical protein